MKMNRRLRLVSSLLASMILVITTLLITGYPVYAQSSTYVFSTGFSSTQGQNQWFYQYKVGNTYTNMSYQSLYGGSWVGNETTLLVSKAALHPGANADSVLKWVAPSAGVWRIAGTVSDKDSGGGDGVNVSILDEDTLLWSQTINNGDTTGKSHNLTRDLSAGEAIYFMVNKRSDVYYDSTNWNPTISLSSSTPTTYQLSTGFSSTQGQSRWFYKYYNGSTYANMSYQSGFGGSWVGNTSTCLIGNAWVHPEGTCEAVITWKAPISGVVTIQGMMDRYEYEGDGVKTKIMKNGSQIWPSSGWQILEPRLAAQHIVNVSVAANDYIYFHVNQNADFGYDSTNWNPKITYNSTPNFLLDKVERVATPSDFAARGIPWMDSSLSTIVQNGSNQWFHSYGATLHSKLAGPLNAPLQTLIANKSNSQFYTNTDPENRWGWWINNVYQINSTELLGFAHLEYCPTTICAYRIGLAYSNNGGATFQRLGYIIRQNVEQSAIHENIEGAPFVIKDGYIYIYYSDYDGTVRFPAVARANLSSVITSARSGQVTTWTKYYNGQWSQPGLGGAASNIIPGWSYSPCVAGTGGDAAYSTTKAKYIIGSTMGFCGGSPDPYRGVWLSLSNDGVAWNNGTWIQNISHSNGTTNEPNRIAAYASIVNIDGSDNGTVGSEFYLYWGFAPRWDDVPTSQVWTYLTTIYRQKVILQ